MYIMLQNKDLDVWIRKLKHSISEIYFVNYCRKKIHLRCWTVF